VSARTRSTILLASGILAAATLSIVALWHISESLHLRGITSSREQMIGNLVWLASFLLLVSVGYASGRAWRSRMALVPLTFPALLAGTLPIAGALFAWSFYYPMWWPKWLDSEFLGGVAALSGGMLGVVLLPFAVDKVRSGGALVILLATWGALVVAGSTWSVLFLE
jgi:hypothetical protein